MVIITNNGRVIFLLKYMVCNGKKSNFVEEQEAKMSLSLIWKIPLLGLLLI